MLEILPPFQDDLRTSKYGHGHLVTCCSEFYVISIGLKLNTTKRQCPYLEVHRSFWNRGSISHNTFTFTLEWSKGNYGQVEQAGYSLSNFMYCTYIEVSCSFVYKKWYLKKMPLASFSCDLYPVLILKGKRLSRCISWFLVHVKVFLFFLSRFFHDSWSMLRFSDLFFLDVFLDSCVL